MRKTPSTTISRKLRNSVALARYYATVSRSGLFDAEYYLAENPDVRQSGVDPLRHYLCRGGFEGRNPSAFFLSEFYLSEYPDVASHDVNPLVHFIRRGDQEGRRPHPFFDPAWYRKHNSYAGSDYGTSLAHYLKEGRQRKYQTCNPKEIKDFLPSQKETDASLDQLAAAVAAWKVRAPYSTWIERFDTLTPERLAALKEASASSYRPTTFCLFIFTNSHNLDGLVTTVRSLRAQIHQNWRALIISDEASAELTRHEELQDSRCGVSTFEGTIAELQGALDETRYRVFGGLLQPGEQLREHALLRAADTLEATPAIEVIYADEDTILPNGARSQPVFKPDWDPLLFACIDYLGSCTFVDAQRFALRPQKTPSAVRSVTSLFDIHTESLCRKNVFHIPAILLHTTESSAYGAKVESSAPRDLESIRAQAPAIYNANLTEASQDTPLVSIAIPTKKNKNLLELCIDSIRTKTKYPRYEIIVIDNDANQETKAYLERLRTDSRCRVLEQPGAFNYSALNNAAAAVAQGELLCLLNDDVEVGCPDWLDTLVAFARQPSVGAVGSLLLYPDGTIQHGGVVIGGHGLAAHSFVGCESPEQSYMALAKYAREASAVTAACLLIEKSKFLSIGGLNEEHLKVNFNDVDLCLRLREKGLTNVILPLPGMIHHESKSRGAATASKESVEKLHQEAQWMRARWGHQLRQDPSYNKNLALSPTLYQLASAVEPDGYVSVSYYNLVGNYSSLGRESRLDIYGDASNQDRAAQASRIIPPPSRPKILSSGLSVIILNKDAPGLIVPLVNQLIQQQKAFERAGLGFEVIIGDTGSTNPDTLQLYDSVPDFVKVVRGMKYNFSLCNNDVESLASFSTALFLNNDIIFPDDLNILRTAFDRLHAEADVGILGGVLVYPDGRIQHMGCDFLKDTAVWGLPYHIHVGQLPASVSIPKEANYPSITGAFLMISRELFRSCGGFDPSYQAECQDIALCLEAHRRGFRSVCVDLGGVVHIENATRPKGEENFADRRRFLRKYGAYIQGAFA
jgi:GT2 family glycosyltransferase